MRLGTIDTMPRASEMFRSLLKITGLVGGGQKGKGVVSQNYENYQTEVNKCLL